MAIEITPARIRATAELARLALTPDEVAPLAAELGTILAHFAELEALDTAAVPPTSHVLPFACPLRPDAPGPCLAREVILAQAPRSEDGAFVVPQFVEE